MADSAPHGKDGPLAVPSAVDAMIGELRRRLDEQRPAQPVPAPGAPAPPLPEAVERARWARLEQRAQAEAATIRQGADVTAARIIADALARADALVNETEEAVARVWAETRAAIDEGLAEVARRVVETEALAARATRDADELRAGAARYLTEVRRRADEEFRKETRQDEGLRKDLEECTLLPAPMSGDDPPGPGPLGEVRVRPLAADPGVADDLLMAGEVRIERGPPLPVSRPLVVVPVGAGPDHRNGGIGHWLRRRRPRHGSHPSG